MWKNKPRVKGRIKNKRKEQKERTIYRQSENFCMCNAQRRNSASQKAALHPASPKKQRKHCLVTQSYCKTVPKQVESHLRDQQKRCQKDQALPYLNHTESPMHLLETVFGVAYHIHNKLGNLTNKNGQILNQEWNLVNKFMTLLYVHMYINIYIYIYI